MKIYYEKSYTNDPVWGECVTPCPFNDAIYKEKNVMCGSICCQECECCYGCKNNENYAIIDYGDGKKVFRPMNYVKCSMCYTKPPIKCTFERFFYQIKLTIKKRFYK